MNKINSIITLVLSLSCSTTAFAKEGFFLFDGDSISLYNEETDIKDETLSEKILKVLKAKNQDFTATGDLRTQILKDLKIEESDSVYIKLYGKTETLSMKVSELKLTAISNFIGTDAPTVGDIVLEIPKNKDRGIAIIGKTNLFNDKTRFDRVMPAKGVYSINPKVSLIEEISRTQQEQDEYKEKQIPNGIYYLKIQIDKKDPEVVNTYNTQDNHFSVDYTVYGGDILNDGSTLIRVSGLSSCGFMVIVKDKEKKVIRPPCGEVGC